MGQFIELIDLERDVDWTKAQYAQKTAQVFAEKVPAGTIVETIMANGFVETSKTAGPEGGYKVTNIMGEQYLVDLKKFESRYQPIGDGVFEPKFDPVMVVKIQDDVSFTASWGEMMRIQSGGVLVKNGSDIYGIQPDEFTNTYQIITNPGEPKPIVP